MTRTFCSLFIIWFLYSFEICDSHSSYSNLSTATKVRKRAAEFQCTLPKYPDHGTYEVVEGEGKPGERIDLNVAIQYTCYQGYKLNQVTPHKVCDQYWEQTSFPQCLQLCPPQYSTTTTTVKCTQTNGAKVDCTEATHGTSLTFECKQYYEKPARFSSTFDCRYGKWKSSAVCEPICGLQVGDSYQLSVNATPQSEIKYPWMTAVYLKVNGEFINVCGGTILSKKLIVTAAHCITNGYGDTFPVDMVRIGIGKLYNKYNDDRDQFSEYHEIRKIIPHPSYNGESRRYGSDIAILVTKKLIQWSPVIQPVCIRDVPFLPLQIGAEGVLPGFGIYEAGNASDVLRVLKIPYKDQQECIKQLPKEFSEKYNLEGKICAGFHQQGTSVCSGDSGSGLVFKHEDGRYYLHGIVSLAPKEKNGNCNIQQNSLYTKVAHYYDFVEQEMKKNFEEQCLLPSYPANGKYVVENDEEKVPGDVVSTASTLKIQCDEGFAPRPDISQIKCEDIQFLPKCVSTSFFEKEFTSVRDNFDKDGIKVICTYASWSVYSGITPGDLDPKLCTHIYYASAGISENGTLKVTNERLEINEGLYRNLTSLKQRNAKLKVLLSVGGGISTNDGLWVNMASDPNKIDNFISSVSQIIRSNDFDGLNIDWHYPQESDKKIYSSFIKKLKKDLDKEGWLITASAGYDFECTGYDIPQMNKSLDWVIVKTYDFYGHWSDYTGIHTALYPSRVENPWEKKHLNVDSVTKNWLAAGMSKSKLVISVAFYGRTFELKDINKHDLHSPIVGAGPGEGILKYHEICAGFRKWRQVKSDEQKSVYKYSGKEWFSYDTPDAIRIKGLYAKNQDLLGVHVFPLDGDDVLGKCGQKQLLLKNLHFGLGHGNTY